MNPQKIAAIISKNPNAIVDQVNYKIYCGVTVLSGHGYYTKEQRGIYIIISSQEVIKLKNIVKAVDKDAFIAIYDVRDVFGKGCSILPECNYKCVLK